MVKYVYRRLGKHIFRVKLQDYNDPCFGLTVEYEIQENVDIPRNLWQRLQQYFKVKTYSDGNWIPCLNNCTLEEKLASAMLAVVTEWNKADDAQKEWDAIC